MGLKTKLAGASAVGLALAAWLAPMGATAAVQPGCTPLTNVEAIIDDSGSMTSTDTGRLRFNAMQLFIKQNPQDTLGAVQFGSNASVIFGPSPVGGNEPNLIGALDAAIQADDGSTNYVDAFKAAHASNPAAQARIFLTDGGQNVNNIDNTNDHRNWGGPLYVIGLDIGAPGTGSDADRLQRLATETGGQYFPNVSSTGTTGVPNSSIQDVVATISSVLSCKGAPVSAQIATLQSSGQSATQTVPVDPGSKSANITLNWGNAGNQYRITKVLVRSHGRTVAQGNVPATTATASAARRHKKRKKKPSKLTVQAQGGPTFQTVNVSGLKPGTLVFQVQATNVTLPETVSALTSQS
jgi:hypothetical protein